MSEPVARIDLTSFATVDDIKFIITQLHDKTPYSIEWVHNAADDEPQMYLAVAEED